jgi:hypothetical protein
MAWLGIICLGLLAELATIVLLGRGVTDRYELGEDTAADDDTSAPPWAAGALSRPW